jgi:hypothetical protein
LLAALDGTDFFASEKSAYPCCTCQTLKNDKALYRHNSIASISINVEGVPYTRGDEPHT